MMIVNKQGGGYIGVYMLSFDYKSDGTEVNSWARIKPESVEISSFTRKETNVNYIDIIFNTTGIWGNCIVIGPTYCVIPPT